MARITDHLHMTTDVAFKQVAQGQGLLTRESNNTVTGQSSWGFYHIWVWWPSWSCDLETLFTSAEQLLSGLCILLSAILVCLKKSSYHNPRGGAIFDPWGMTGRISVKLNMTLLHIKYTSFVSCGCREDFFMYFHYK